MTLKVDMTAEPRAAADDPIMPPAEAAKFLGFSESWLAKQRHSQTGPTWIRLGLKKVGYRRSALEAWITECDRRREPTQK